MSSFTKHLLCALSYCALYLLFTTTVGDLQYKHKRLDTGIKNTMMTCMFMSMSQGCLYNHVVFSGGGQLEIGDCSRGYTKCEEERGGHLEGPDELLGSVKEYTKAGMSSQGSGGEGAKGTPLAGEGSASEPPGRQKTQRMEPPRAEEGDLMPRSPHLADPAPAHCRRRTGTPRHPLL